MKAPKLQVGMTKSSQMAKRTINMIHSIFVHLSAANRFLSVREERAGRLSDPGGLVTNLSVFRHIDTPTAGAYNLCAIVLGKKSSGRWCYESFGGMRSSKVE
jgi:hypothetical protein